MEENKNFCRHVCFGLGVCFGKSGPVQYYFAAGFETVDRALSLIAEQMETELYYRLKESLSKNDFSREIFNDAKSKTGIMVSEHLALNPRGGQPYPEWTERLRLESEAALANRGWKLLAE